MMLCNRIDLKAPHCRARRSVISLAAAIALCLQHSLRARAENHADYKYEDYLEDNRRIHVETQSALVETDLLPWLTARGNYTYDSISGATPNGAPPQLFPQHYLAEMRDIRRAGFLETAMRLGPQTFTPQIAYSKESDYKSIGISLNYAIDFNQKNTTLNLGFSQNFDQVIFTPNTDNPALFGQTAYRNSTDFLVGISQLLGPKTVLTANISLGMDSGDLNDPYREVYFQDFLPQTVPTLFPEIRPRHRLKEIAYLSLTHFVTPLDGSVEGYYRFHHDSFGIYANTVSVAWLQKLGKHLVLSPSFRFYQQTAASFYVTSLPANVEDPQLASIGPPSTFGFASGPPTFYSADYRLSSFASFTYGISATWKINQHVYFDAAFQRYDMRGTDGVTSPLLYPKANIINLGLRLWF